MVNPKIIKCLFVVFFLKVSFSAFGGIADEGLKHLSMHERACMKAFFDDAIKMDQIAHVLYFENKPVSLIARILKAKDRPFNEVLCLKGWGVFKKNEHLFPHPHFIFSENIVNFGKDFKVLHVYLMNKKSLEICLNRHLPVFKEILGQEFNATLFIKELEEGHSLDSLVNKNEMLLGILLGFGEESSKAYRDFNAGYPAVETYSGIDIRSPKRCKIQHVAFMGNPYSPEVKRLIQIYEKELEEFFQNYYRKKELESGPLAFLTRS